MKINEGKILLLLTGILSGILLVVFMVNNSAQTMKVLTFNQYKELQIQANSIKAENRGLYKKYNELEKKLERYQNSGDETDDKVNKVIREELKDIKLFYGITEVSGPGVTITLNDNRKEYYKTSLEQNNSIVHNIDLYEVVNELRNSGAEAIAINGYRVVAQSTITCEGPTIMIDGNNIVPPFDIDVIGDTSAIEFTMASQENKFGSIKLRELKMNSKEFENKTLPAYIAKNNVNYMKEVKEGH